MNKDHMISKIAIKNFKSIFDNDLYLTPIALLTGLNNTGKSSVIQAIMTCVKHNIPDGLGDIKELKCRNSIDYPEIKIFFNNKNFIEYRLGIPEYEHSKELTNVHYISADRFGPRVSLPFSIKSIDVGIHGEYVYSLLNTYRNLNGVPEKLRHESIPDTSSAFEQIRAWLDIISPGIKFDFEIYEKVDIGTGIFSESRSTNSGFGLSYALPILVHIIIFSALLSKSDNSSGNEILLLENPEAHLHPHGQTQLGRFFALASQCGIQIIIETHSEHILNGIRLAVKEKNIPPEDCIFYYFSKDEQTENSEILPIFIDENGMLDNWPEGFFDESEKILMRIL